MAQFPTWREFVAFVEENHDVQLKHSEISIEGPDGQDLVQYLQREFHGESLVCLVCIEDEERLLPDTIRSICAALQLPTEDFGLPLG